MASLLWRCGLIALAAVVLALPTSIAQEACFVTLGSWGSGSEGQARSAAALDLALADCSLGATSMIFTTGNNILGPLDNVTDPKWQSHFRDIYSERALQQTWYITMGDLDYFESSTHELGKAAVLEAYGMEHPGWRLPAGQQHYHAETIVLADEAWLQIIVLDTPMFDKRQQLWLENILVTSTADYVQVVGHHALYNTDWPYAQLLQHVFSTYHITAYHCGEHRAIYYKQASGFMYWVNGAGSDINATSDGSSHMDFAFADNGVVGCQVTAALMVCSVVDAYGQTAEQLVASPRSLAQIPLNNLHALDRVVDGNTKVACVGDSITRRDPTGSNPPFELLWRLDSGRYGEFLVHNYGVDGAGYILSSPLPYFTTSEYSAVIEFNPDIVFLELGTNDIKASHWDTAGPIGFEHDMRFLISSLRNLSSNPTIFLVLPPKLSPERTGSMSQPRLESLVLPVQTRVYGELAEATSGDCQPGAIHVIDLQPMLDPSIHLKGDGIHPNDAGREIVAISYLHAMLHCLLGDQEQQPSSTATSTTTKSTPTTTTSGLLPSTLSATSLEPLPDHCTEGESFMVLPSDGPPFLQTIGPWQPAFQGDYPVLHDNGTHKGELSAEAWLHLPAPGTYAVYMAFLAAPTNAESTHLTVLHATGTAEFELNQQANEAPDHLAYIGTFAFNVGDGGVRVENTGTLPGNVVVLGPIHFVCRGPAKASMSTSTVSSAAPWLSTSVSPSSTRSSIASSTPTTTTTSVTVTTSATATTTATAEPQSCIPGTTFVIDQSYADQVTVSGPWELQTGRSAAVNDNFLLSVPGAMGELFYSATFLYGGLYNVHVSYVANSSRASAVRYQVYHANGHTVAVLDQRVAPAASDGFAHLGTFLFHHGDLKAGVQVSANDWDDGRVVGDAARFDCVGSTTFSATSQSSTTKSPYPSSKTMTVVPTDTAVVDSLPPPLPSPWLADFHFDTHHHQLEISLLVPAAVFVNLSRISIRVGQHEALSFRDSFAVLNGSQVVIAFGRLDRAALFQSFDTVAATITLSLESGALGFDKIYSNLLAGELLPSGQLVAVMTKPSWLDQQDDVENSPSATASHGQSSLLLGSVIAGCVFFVIVLALILRTVRRQHQHGKKERNIPSSRRIEDHGDPEAAAAAAAAALCSSTSPVITSTLPKKSLTRKDLASPSAWKGKLGQQPFGCRSDIVGDFVLDHTDQHETTDINI